MVPVFWRVVAALLLLLYTDGRPLPHDCLGTFLIRVGRDSCFDFAFPHFPERARTADNKCPCASHPHFFNADTGRPVPGCTEQQTKRTQARHTSTEQYLGRPAGCRQPKNWPPFHTKLPAQSRLRSAASLSCLSFHYFSREPWCVFFFPRGVCGTYPKTYAVPRASRNSPCETNIVQVRAKWQHHCSAYGAVHCWRWLMYASTLASEHA